MEKQAEVNIILRQISGILLWTEWMRVDFAKLTVTQTYFVK